MMSVILIPFRAAIVLRYLQGAWLVLCLVGCATPPEVSPEVLAHGDTKLWKREQIVGLRIRLIDAKNIVSMSFSARGFLVGNYGEVGGKVCGPVTGWKLVRGRLFLSDLGRNKFGSELHLVRMEEGILTLRQSSGLLEKYQILSLQ